MPKADQLSDAAQQGVQVVINLAVEDVANGQSEEGELVESLGMKYINVPVVWHEPTRKNLDDFINAMDAHKDQKMLVHCEANYRATGFVALYRILRLGWDQEEAFQDMRKLWNPEKFPVWQKFIDENLPKNSG
jgi:protein tyrosine phosphatase (PTP) superfamily phosphohydrolase (DUF442 family)